MAPHALFSLFTTTVSTTSALQKRDNMGYAISPSLIVFLCMLGAGMLVCLGFAVYRLAFGDTTHMLPPMSDEQGQYIREVRERNIRAIEMLYGGRMYAKRSMMTDRS
jgi:hypothetical protein